MSVTLNLTQTSEKITVKDWREVGSVLRKEYAHWDWLNDNTNNVANAALVITSGYQNLINQAQAYENQGADLAIAENFLSPFLNGPLLHHESANGALILDIKGSAGAVAAAYALAFLQGQVTMDSIRSPEGLRGVMLLAFPDMGVASEIEMTLRHERDRYKSSLKSGIAAVKRGQDEREERWRTMVRNAKRLGVSQLRKARTSAGHLQDDWMEEIANAVREFKQTEEAYKSFMGLRAPAEYWEKKSQEHGAAKTTDLTNVKWYFGGMITVLSVLFVAAGCLIYDVHNAKNEPVALYVLISAGLAVLSTIGFWIGRILTKLYLSEHHLKTDAEERRVMIMTYLALVENGAASPEEKTIVLNAIFRSTSDGIVKDDGLPDVGFQAVASKFLAGGR